MLSKYTLHYIQPGVDKQQAQYRRFTYSKAYKQSVGLHRHSVCCQQRNVVMVALGIHNACIKQGAQQVNAKRHNV